ncbi:MAG: hypothetical protein ACOX5R_10665 [bacterium]|jgi:hypothetical protein
MSIMHWNAFEKLMDVARGDVAEDDEFELIERESLLNLIEKCEKLEQLRTRFQNANEETIMQDYHLLRKAHNEFMSSLNEAYHTLKVQNRNANQAVEVL